MNTETRHFPKAGKSFYFEAEDQWALCEKVSEEFSYATDDFMTFCTFRFPDGTQCKLSLRELFPADED